MRKYHDFYSKKIRFYEGIFLESKNYLKRGTVSYNKKIFLSKTVVLSYENFSHSIAISQNQVKFCNRRAIIFLSNVLSCVKKNSYISGLKVI